jgi:hypothetical protein
MAQKARLTQDMLRIALEVGFRQTIIGWEKFGKVLMEAKARSGNNPIGTKLLREIVGSFCPLFPFC